MPAHRSVMIFILCLFVVSLFSLFLSSVAAKKGKKKPNTVSEEDKWKMKDVRDYHDGDLEHLYEQWQDPKESAEDRAEKDRVRELYGQPRLLSVSFAGERTEEEVMKITNLWMSQLANDHLHASRLEYDKSFALFYIKESPRVMEALRFFVSQPECEKVDLDNKPYFGRGSDQFNDSVLDPNIAAPKDTLAELSEKYDLNKLFAEAELKKRQEEEAEDDDDEDDDDVDTKTEL